MVGIYLKEQGYAIGDIEDYLIWLAGKLGLPEFEEKSASKQIVRESFPSCKTIQKSKKGRGPYILKLGDLDLEDVCAHCPYEEEHTRVTNFL